MQASQNIKTSKMANTKNTSKLDTKNKKRNCMFFKNNKNNKTNNMSLRITAILYPLS